MNLQQNGTAPLYGLVAAGGRSVRMGREKGGLTYWRRPQVERTCRLLDPFCRDVFVSVRKEQKHRSWCAGRPQVHDLFRDLGPVSGLLSAMIRYPRAAWMFVACDMPFLNFWTVRALSDHRNPFRRATVYRSPGADIFEPVCAIYEPGFQTRVEEALGRGIQSLRRMLSRSSVEVVSIPEHRVLTSVDTPDEFARTERMIQTGGTDE